MKNPFETIDARLSNIENLLLDIKHPKKDAVLSEVDELLKLRTKTVLSFDEVAIYTGLSKSYLYKLTSTGQIPHYKPNGKMCYFNKLEVDNWLQQNRIASSKELETKATNYVTLKKK